MTCEQFQELLPEIGGGNRNIEYETHLRSCQECWGLVSDLNAISRQAPLLQASEEPGPELWNSIESALREEGLIRSSRQQPVLVLKSKPRWNLAWMLPAAASVLIVLGVLNYQGKIHSVSTETAPAITAQSVNTRSPLVASFSAEDQKFLTAIAFRSPTLRAKYERGLRDVNAYIRDAQQSALNDPNDEEAQRYLMSAYDQKAMLYQMALDRFQ
ncbi:MAG TPA: hypothetical protein VN684_04720 [Terriglobales bacterium]|nr:hypothetical protein [Terriglobales bacterium]